MTFKDRDLTFAIDFGFEPAVAVATVTDSDGHMLILGAEPVDNRRRYIKPISVRLHD